MKETFMNISEYTYTLIYVHRINFKIDKPYIIFKLNMVFFKYLVHLVMSERDFMSAPHTCLPSCSYQNKLAMM